MSKIDGIMEELLRYSYKSGGELVKKLEENLAVSEFGATVELLRGR
jgi:hypothetical protein